MDKTDNQPVALFITVGQTDLQVMVTFENQQTKERFSFPFSVGKNSVKLFCDEFLTEQQSEQKKIRLISYKHYQSLAALSIPEHPDTLMTRLEENKEKYRGEISSDKSNRKNVKNWMNDKFVELRDQKNVLSLYKESDLAKKFDIRIGPFTASTRSDEPDIAVTLLPTKLFTMLKYLGVYQQGQQGYPMVSSVVVFNTCRDKGSTHSDKEPYAYGPVIARWLATELNLTYCGEYIAGQSSPVGGAFYCNYLYGDMNAEGDKQHAPVNRKAVQNIDQVVRHLVQAYAQEKIKPQALYSPGGGLPQFKSPIESVLRYYFDKVDIWVAADGDSRFTTEDQRQDAHAYPTLDISYQARRQALGLICQGNFEGARAIAEFFVSPEQKVVSDRQWAEAVIMTAKWFQGNASLEELNQVYCQQTGEPVLDFASESAMPNTLWAAFRIEAALRKQNYQEAMRFTADLYDVALYDIFGQALAGNFDYFHGNNFYTSNLHTNNPKSSDYDRAKYERACQRLLPGEEWTKSRLQVVKEKNISIDTRISYRSPQRSLANDIAVLLSSQLIETESGEIPADKLDQHPLTVFRSRLRDELLDESQPTAQQYRNIITHGYLPVEKQQAAVNYYRHEKVGLWAAQERETFQFLSQPLFKDLYGLLSPENTDEPALLYRQLTDKLTVILTNVVIDSAVDE
ncbi:hypothetical protein [Vibrio sp. MEBiC08052]|uniref:hypothetical protein n=1 Tax=Vibrio sp. MEBiC08052 TaxID=1761910 RepID=UPI000740D6CE|nr:hypothetical protein [Vibrio sp. MEBiC08052]